MRPHAIIVLGRRKLSIFSILSGTRYSFDRRLASVSVTMVMNSREGRFRRNKCSKISVRL